MMFFMNTTVYANVASLLDELIDSDDAYHQTHRKRIGRTLSVLLDEQPTSGKLLELGTSHVYPLALKEFVPNLQVHVTEFDLSKPEKGKKAFKHGERSRSCPVYRVNLEDTPLPVEDETFDYVLCTEVIEHMEKDPMFMMSEINRVLKPGGTLVLTTPNVVSTHGVNAMLENKEPYFYMHYRAAGTLDRHNYEYTLWSVSQVLRAAGFKGKGWTEDTFGAPDLGNVMRLRAAGYPMQHVGDNIFCVSKKEGPVVNRFPGVIYSD